jgi:4,5:9,10-diseco-3-hydroxy-5,9,17-trioxoandrosta-1(10),2-diene-4-oate hydrolase
MEHRGAEIAKAAGYVVRRRLAPPIGAMLRRRDAIETTVPDGPDPYGDRDPAWLKIDWREHLHSVDVAGTPIAYVEIGEGRPIVFVHGLSGSWQNWLENIPILANRGFRVLALDLPGFGASPMPAWPISIPAFSSLVDEFSLALNLHAVTLVGNSMGGFICAEVAIRDPIWVESLVLVSAAGISHATMKRHPAEISAPLGPLIEPLSARLRDASMRRPGLRDIAFGNVFRHPRLVPRELLWEFWQAGTDCPGFMPSVRALAGYDFLDRLEGIAVPTLIVWGADDRIVPARDAAGYHERIRESELVILADCAHVPMAERPVRFNHLVERFAGSC